MEQADMVPVPDSQITYADNGNGNEASQSATQGVAQDATQGAPQGFTRAMTLKGVRTSFMANIPYNEFKFPEGGAINATMVDIIVLLPQWFRNPRLLTRFMNNGLTAAFHFYILEKHRYLDIHTEEEAERAREHLSAAYRHNMRKTVASWTRRNHKVPRDWDDSNMDIRDYLPEAAKKPHYEEPRSIKFTDVGIGVKQLPRGDDAGDLTRALIFAMNNRKTKDGRKFHYVFPDDMQVILDQIGRSNYTEASFDYAAIDRYEEALIDAKTMLFGQASGAVQQTVGSTPQQAGLGRQNLTQSFGQLPRYSKTGQPDLMPPYQPPPQRAIFGHSGLTQSLEPLSGYNGFGQLVPMPSYQQWPHQAPFRQQGPAPLPCAPTSTYGMPLSYVPNPYQSTNAQQAVAAVASKFASDSATRHLAQPPTVYLPDIPGLCKYTGEEPVEPLQFPKRCTEGQPMDGLMATNQTRELGSPPPWWLDLLSEQDGDAKQQFAVGATDPPSPFKKLGSHLPWLDPLFQHDQDAKQQSAASTIDPPPPCTVLAGYDEHQVFKQDEDAKQQLATSLVDPLLLSPVFVGHNEYPLFKKDEAAME